MNAKQQDQPQGSTANGQKQEPEPTPSGSVAPFDYEVRVTLTVAVPYRGKYPGLGDAMENVIAALRQGACGNLPEGTYLRGGIDARVRTAKEIAADTKRAAAKRRRES